MTKAEKIEEFLKQPIKVGDIVSIQGTSLRNPDNWEWATVNSINGDTLLLNKETTSYTRNVSEVKRIIDHIGVDPFKKEIRTIGYQVDIEQLLWRAGYSYTSFRRTSGEKEGIVKRYEEVGVRAKSAPEVCDNPMVINEKGEEVEFQRGLVWTEEQKQLLIESIWNNIEIGKVVLRQRSFNWVQKRIKEGKIEHTAFADLVDGKQRINALVSYIKGEFCDLSGNYWYDLSEGAKRKFMSYRNVSYVELEAEATDSDTISTFLSINFTGVPMSRDHIKFVQSIKI
ncbi:MAG: DUF262 domain-containing protein [Bacteroidia bacterium]